ncbi:BTAD domain-containing putative transcriptional regulator [Nonomuraea sp. NPDC050556]|uniref:BTAD domain-containing putative transcriptional regulator n=1 Tax=Nonomuraea sp. NPDC050556 TaxID=3364369 RepID=UPI0037A5750F
MRVEILGPPQVVLDGQAPVEITGARLRALLVRLAMAAGRVVSVEQLAQALWPEEPPADPANAVQSLVARLRRSLPDAAALVSVPGGYRLVAGTDADAFDLLVRQAATGADPAAAAEALDAALELWRGPALGEVAGAPFASAFATRLEEARLAAVEERAAARLAAGGEPGPLVAELDELATRHPLRERLQAARIRALHAAGRRAEALAAYEGVRRRLAEELGADPGPELRELHLALLRDGSAPRRTNLKAPLTSFVGRDREVEQVGGQLREGRLITLVGPGGAGKTRLATTVAATVPGPVWLVELAAVTDPGDVPQAVLAALGQLGGAAPPGPRDTLSRLVEALSGGPALLVLDNCEHLVEAAARVAEELLGRCPQLRVLATSREPLAIGGEALCPVRPLAPEPAVRLFTDRVAAVQPGFALTGANAGVVREVCRRLDGLPLAIELAAARLRALTLEQLAARLDDRFLLLTGGSRTALPRHQTLRAVVAWSWDLLEEPERQLVERLAVFSGGFDLAAAEHLGGTLDLVAALVDKSLLRGDGEGRYGMLETLREYGLERLAHTGRIAEARTAHAAYFLALAERAEPYLRGREQVSWIRRLLAEHDNLLAALHYAVDCRDADTAVRLAAALGVFWTIRGNRAESVGWLRLALEVPGTAPEQARIIASATFLVNGALAGGDARVESAVEELRRLSELPDDQLEHPVIAMLRPALALFTDNAELGFAAIECGLAHRDPWTRGMMLNVRAALRENEGDMSGSRADLIAAAAELRAAGERWGLSMALTGLAEANAVFGDLDGAVAALEEAMALLMELNPDDDTGHQRVWLAGVRARRGELDQSRAELRLITEPSAREWSPRNVAFARSALGDLARYEGDLDTAEREYALASAGLEYAPAIAPQFRALIITGRAHLAVLRGSHAEAAALIGRAAELALDAGDMPVLAKVAVATAGLLAGRGDLAGAARVMGAAEQLRGAPDAGNPDIVRLSTQLRSALGEEAYLAAHRTGRALSRKAAVEAVLLHDPVEWADDDSAGF